MIVRDGDRSHHWTGICFGQVSGLSDYHMFLEVLAKPFRVCKSGQANLAGKSVGLWD